MNPIERIIERSRETLKTIVLPEGCDPRTWTAARRLIDEGIAKPIVLCEQSELDAAHKEANVVPDGIPVINPVTSDKHEHYAEEFARIREHKGLTLDEARTTLNDVLYYGAMMVRMGDADGGVTGAAHTTGDVIRAAIQSIGLAPGINIVSSIFLMVVPDGRVFSFGDCAIVPDPDSEQLAAIAFSSAATHKALTGEQPTVAMLSFSTKGSAQHELVDKVISATEKARAMYPDIRIDGELQLDAAIIEKIGAKKAPGSPVAGKANVLVFPDLNSGNIGYKLTERLAGAQAIGPIVQGLAKPFFDLSRGCSADDIVKLSAICSVIADALEGSS